LKELFLINLSDPESPSEVFFKSVFNLMVFFHKQSSIGKESTRDRAVRGVQFYNYWTEVRSQKSLPLIFYNEIDFLGANLFYLSGDTEKSVEIYSELSQQSQDLMSRGLVLNNFGVSLTKALFEKISSTAKSQTQH
jgi:hypothetical protein